MNNNEFFLNNFNLYKPGDDIEIDYLKIINFMACCLPLRLVYK